MQPFNGFSYYWTAPQTKGLLGEHDTTVEALEKFDLTNAQKRDERFYPPNAVIVFNQEVREAEPGAKGKLGGIVKARVLAEVNGKFLTFSAREDGPELSFAAPHSHIVCEGGGS